MFGSIWGGNNRQKDPEVRRLEEQIEDMRADQDRERERQYQEREARRKAQRQEQQERMLYADSWKDGFWKCIARARQEAAAEQADARQNPDDKFTLRMAADNFFGKWADNIAKAETIYDEEMKHVEEVIARYRKAALKRIAGRVEKDLEDTALAEALRDDNPNYLTNW